MRDCYSCVRKHVSQVLVLYDEYRLGHQDHGLYIIGHLAEIESHMVDKYADIAFSIRELRKIFEADGWLDTTQLGEIYANYVRHRDAKHD